MILIYWPTFIRKLYTVKSWIQEIENLNVNTNRSKVVIINDMEEGRKNTERTNIN